VIPVPTSNNPPVRKEFDYSSLDDEARQFVQQQTGEIRGLMKRTAQDIVEIGQRLIDVKERLGYGRFLDWLKAEFDWNRRTANRFMSVAEQFSGNWDNLSHLKLAPSALYILAAPSTPKFAREEALSRAEAGEPITYTTAKEIKKKYTSSTTKSKSKAEPEPEQTPVVLPLPTLPTPPTPLPPSSPLEIVGFRTPTQASTPEITQAEVTGSVTAPQPPQIVTPESPGIWWRLSGRHLLYCGNPNSVEFLGRVTEEVQLLLAFPPVRDWQPAVRARTRHVVEQFLPQGKSLEQLDDILESIVLFHSNLEDLVVCCFVPSLGILPVLNRLDRRGLLAEPDARRCQAIVADWKRSGLKVERLS